MCDKNAKRNEFRRKGWKNYDRTKSRPTRMSLLRLREMSGKCCITYSNKCNQGGGGRHLLVAKIDRKSRIKMEMCSRLRSEVRLPQFVWIQACSISWETVARSAGSFFKQQATKSHISALAPQPAGKEGGSSLTILFMISQ